MTDLTTRLAELKAVAEKATPGPWHLGDRWHIQGAEFCTCAERHGPLIREQLMDINGEMMLAHVHEGAQSWYPHGIMTEPWEDGHPRSVVYTTSEYGHPAREDEEHIATFDPPTVLALIAAVEGVVAVHRPVYPVFSWWDGLRYDEPCEECNGKAGVHECGCWADEDMEYECMECIRKESDRDRRSVPWPCPTIQAITDALGVER